MTKVLFRVDRLTGEVVAVFPHENWSPFFVTSYTHVGQHSGCTQDYAMYLTRPARPDEFADLLRELRFMGYHNLRVLAKAPARDKWALNTN